MKVDSSPSQARSEFESYSDTYTQNFLKTLPRKLHDPSLLQACPVAPSPVIFKHNDKNELAARANGTSGKDVPFQGPLEAWGSHEHLFTAPPGSYKLLSSDYAWLDAPRSRRDGHGAGAPGSQQEDESAPIPEPPLAMQQTRFLAHARLVLVKLRQQLEEICVGAVKRMENVVTAPPMPSDMLTTPALSTRGSFPGSTISPTLTSIRSITVASMAASTLGVASTTAASGGPATGGIRLPPGFIDALADNIRDKLGASFDDCLTDIMDQLWNALQYAGSKHAIVERLAEAMKNREAELEATAARYREEAASRIRILRRQKEEIEAAAEKERAELQARAAAASQRLEFLERDVLSLRGAVEKERAEGAARLEAQRAAYEAALAAKEEAIEAVRADSVARLEEMRVLNAGLQEQLAQRTEEVARLSTRATDQADILALALDRRDGTFKELEALTGQLEDFKRFVQAPAAMPLTDWMLTLQENGSSLTPLMGGPLSMEYGTGRAFMATARHHGLHAVQEELRRVMPTELPWPEDGWPSDAHDAVYEEETGGKEGAAGRSPSPSEMTGKAAYPATLPLTWLRFGRAPLANIMSGPELMAILANLSKAKREADVAARRNGLPPPDLHTFVYKRIFAQHSSAIDADEVVVSLVQSLRAHAKNLPRAAIWLQLLQLNMPVLPLDACTYYMEVFHMLLVHDSAVVEKPACIVWVSPTRWKTLLTGSAGAVFDTERKVALLKMAATVRVDTARGNKSFGMSEGDALIAMIMAQWLSQRQAAIASLAAAWSSLEPVGGGVLAVNISVDELAKVANASLGRDVLPTDRDYLLELYFNTVQAARTAQATSLVKWSGITTAALGTALANAELLPPRPLHPRLSPSRSRLAAAAGQMLRIADAAAEQMRTQPIFKQQQCMSELEGAITRMRQAVHECNNSREPVRDVIEEERRALLGWMEMETMTSMLLTAQEAFRVYEANLREQMIKMAVEGLSKGKSAEDAEKGADRFRTAASLPSRLQSALRTRSKGPNRNPQSSDNGSSANDNSPVQSPRRDLGTVFATATALSFTRNVTRMGSASRHGPSSRAGSARPASRDLRAALVGAAGHLSSDDEVQQSTTDGGMPPALVALPGRPSRTARSSSKSTAGDSNEAPEETLAALVAADSGLGSHGSTGDGSGSSSMPTSPPSPLLAAGTSVVTTPAEQTPTTGQPNATTAAMTAAHEIAAAATLSTACPDDPAVLAKLSQLDDKYRRLHSRFSQTMRALNAAYQNASGDAGAGLPAPEVMSQLGPAAKLRVVAELLAELHREVEEGVWPHLDSTVMEAINQTNPSGGASSRPQSARVPGLHVTAVRSGFERKSGLISAASYSPPGTMAGAVITTVASAPVTDDMLNVEAAWAGAEARAGDAVGAATGGGSEVSSPASVRLGRVGSKLSDVKGAVPVEAGDEAPGSGVPGVADVQEVTGLLHAHAGHVSRVISVAAMETAALAAALDELSVRRSGTSNASVLRNSLTWAGGAGTTDSIVLLRSSTEGGMWPGGNHGTAQGGMSSDGSLASRSTPVRLTAGGEIAALLSGLPAGPTMALLHRSATFHSGKGPGLVLPLMPIPTLRPLSAGALGALHPPLSMSSASSRTGTRYEIGTGGAPGVSASGGGAPQGAQAEGAADVRSGMNPDDDPRDTTYLEALRALHVAAESQAVSEGNVAPLIKAVREVVRLMGGQPQLGDDGNVIEFYPRRIPTDWRHPVLRNSVTRLYIYVCGALLQQHERGQMIQEASADLAARHTALVRAAEDLELKAAGLRDLQTTLGRQLATLASWVGHGSVLMSHLQQLNAVGEHLKGRVATMQVSERTSPPVLSPTLQSRNPSLRGQPSVAQPSLAQPSVAQPSVAQPSASGNMRSNGGLLSRSASRKGSPGALTPVQSAAAREVATVAGVAAAAAAAAAAATMVLPLAVHGESLMASMGAPLSAGGGGAPVPTAAAKPARPPTKIVVFTMDEWDMMKQIVSNVAAAISQLKESALPLVALAHPAFIQGPSSLGPSTPGKPVPAGPILPTGDRILAVHVNVASSATSGSTPRLLGARVGPTDEATAAVRHEQDDSDQLPTSQSFELPQQLKLLQQQQDSISFVVDIPLPPTPGTLDARDTVATTFPDELASSRASTAPIPIAPDIDVSLDNFHRYPTPPVSREASVPKMALAVAATQGFSLKMSLREAQTAPRSTSAGCALPPGEELVRLSNSLLRRSSMAAIRKHLWGCGGGSNGSRRPSPSARPAADGLRPLPPHYERRPMTARAFVEGVMMQAREQQLERLYGVAGHMPRGAMPEVDGLAQTDDHEASLLEHRALVLASPEPKPATALDILLQEHSEEAAQANEAAASAVAGAVSAATAAAAGAQPHPGPGPAISQTDAAAAAGAPILGSAVSTPRQEESRRQLRPTSNGFVVHSRLASGVSGTRLSTLPPVGGAAALAGMGSETALAVPSAHLGYYPGLQVDVAGRLSDWRLPVLAQQVSQQSIPSERGASQQGAA